VATLLRPVCAVAQGETDVLRVWFDCSPFVSSEYGETMIEFPARHKARRHRRSFVLYGPCFSIVF
jgi:hypothetical protein